MQGSRVDDRNEVHALLSRMQQARPTLARLLKKCSDHWGYEDPVYRFYHQSYKIYDLQQRTVEIVRVLQALAPETPLNEWFMTIVKRGTGKTFKLAHNKRWLSATRPIVEAFFHARYFLEMAVRYGKKLDAPPALLPSGWASLLYLYGLR
jgi:hypothetical protein